MLLLSYFWPPFGGAGVQRALKLAIAARDFGWRVTVVAAQPRDSDPLDPSLLPEVPADMHVVRVDHPRLADYSRRLGPWVPPDPYRPWRRPALVAARDLVLGGDLDAVVSTSMPYTAHLVARSLRIDYGLPWLADLRDPWTDNRFLAHYQGGSLRSRWRRFADTRMERGVYAAADHLTVTAAPLRQLLIDQWGIEPTRVHLVRNGYDEADFAGIVPPLDTAAGAGTAASAPRSSTAGERTGPMRVLFAGSMYAGYTIEPFLAAWQRLADLRPDVELVFDAVTQSRRLIERLLERYPAAAACTTLHDRMAHDAVVRRYGDADMLVLATLDDLSIPGKLFEYIRSGTPVLAFAVPGAESHALLAETGAGTCAPHDDADAGARTLADWYDRWRAGETLTEPQATAVASLDRRQAYARLFGVLDRMVATE